MAPSGLYVFYCACENSVRFKLHRFDFDLSLYLLQSCCAICRQQINQMEFGPYVYVCANNQQVTVCIAICFKHCSQRLLPGDYTRLTEQGACPVGELAGL